MAMRYFKIDFVILISLLCLFSVFGGALFQMWQTPIGAGSLANAFQFFMACGLVFIIVNLADA